MSDATRLLVILPCQSWGSLPDQCSIVLPIESVIVNGVIQSCLANCVVSVVACIATSSGRSTGFIIGVGAVVVAQDSNIMAAVKLAHRIKYV